MYTPKGLREIFFLSIHPLIVRPEYADGDRSELHDQTRIQEHALDGIHDALGDLEMMGRVRAPPVFL